MVARSGFCDDEDDGDREDGQGFGVYLRQQPGNNRRFKFRNVVRDVMNGRSMGEISALLEPLLRKVVREEVERVALHSFSRPSHNQIEPARGRSLQLDFVTKMPVTIFTNNRIEPEDGSPVTIILRDAATKAQISTGPLSSTKVEIVVLDGDFGADDREDWTPEEFSAKIVRERQGKRPLAAGELTVTLRDGVGFAGDIVFTDNSSWIRSRKFRLGARVTQRTSSSGEVTVREARSEAFMVKDHRGELYKKHYPPSPADDVWRLDRIAKDGAFHKRLVCKDICTVRDFLRLYVTDQSALRNVLGNGVSSKIWETIVDHALTCVVEEDEMYTYYGSTHRVCLLFDSVYRVVGATFDGHNFMMDLDKLTLSQKLAIEDTKREAYKNIDGLSPLDRRAAIGPSRPLIAQQAQSAIGPDLNLQELYLLPLHQDQLEPSLPQAGFFTPSLRNSFVMRELLSMPCTGNNGWSPSGTLQSPFVADQGDDMGDTNDHHHEPSYMQLPPWNTTFGQGNGFFFAATDEPQFGIMDRTRARWCKLRACFMFDSVRRNVLARRRRLLYMSY